ncbi:phosphosulfolactate synthase [Methanobrevibacter sp. DSM 116169]|uniref:phosphosulfolactate synthase n=1 Tax=Methanobrevibacter sp. DSM 116169 TaxID=3242727 RepID=UPI0038FC42E5
MKSFNFLLEGTNNKPRDSGLTMVLDKGLGFDTAKSLMEVSGDYVDYLKFGWGTTAIQDFNLLKEKVAMYKSFDIIPYVGGTLFEIAYDQNKLDEFLDRLKKLGFETIEISDGSININRPDKLDCIKKVKDMGFEVISEVGKKNLVKDQEITIEDRANFINEELDAGSSKVIVEAREGGKSIGVFDDEGNAKEEEVNYILDNVDKNSLIWEAPNKNQQVFFILQIGADVNLGNISSDDITSLETLRRGLRGDTLGKV